MSTKPDFIVRKNEELNNTPFRDLSYLKLLNIWNESEDPFENLLYKYSKEINSFKKFTINNEELIFVKTLKNDQNNIIISFVLELLIACSKDFDNSHAVDYFYSFLESYISNYDEGHYGSATHTLIYFLKWCVNLFPKLKVSIKNNIYQKMVDKIFNPIESLSLCTIFMRDKTLTKFFTAYEYDSIFDSFVPKKIDKKYLYFYLDLFPIFISYLELNCKKIIKKWKEKYCDFVLYNIDEIDSLTKQILLRNIMDMMDNLQKYTQKDYLLISSHLKKANKESLDKMIVRNIPFDKETSTYLENISNAQKQKFESLHNDERLLYVVREMDPISLKQIIENQKSKKEALASTFGELFVDESGQIINYKQLDKDDMFMLTSLEDITNLVNLHLFVFLRHFFDTCIIDKGVSGEICEFINNSSLTPPERSEYISNKFINFFKKDFLNSVSDIVLEFEHSIRYYFENQGFYVHKKNKNNDFIGLSDIFNFNKVNDYRDNLLEIIDENFYFTLTTLLTHKYGYGLRNKIAHRYQSENIYSSSLSIYACIQIFRLYVGLDNK